MVEEAVVSVEAELEAGAIMETVRGMLKGATTVLLERVAFKEMNRMTAALTVARQGLMLPSMARDQLGERRVDALQTGVGEYEVEVVEEAVDMVTWEMVKSALGIESMTEEAVQAEGM